MFVLEKDFIYITQPQSAWLQVYVVSSRSGRIYNHTDYLVNPGKLYKLIKNV